MTPDKMLMVATECVMFLLFIILIVTTIWLLVVDLHHPVRHVLATVFDHAIIAYCVVGFLLNCVYSC
jgi:hypothetical protein